ncbi:MAG: hypothetical protein CO189_09485 [candidate division Zixibacteria bacterium CG_4_9_14_3_um_filter_46_8]|nr:MAG: hypothetical protein CO189_09485 [candidate division Zixibacteria bacterium CG_4_9_14_3_um_filter_46_8]
MPEVKEKESAQTPEVAPATEVKSGKKSKLTAIILILELISIAAAYFVVNDVLKPRIPEWYHPEEVAPKEVQMPGVILTIEDLVVNPANSGGTRYLSTSLGVEVRDEEANRQLELRKPAIRDALIRILSAETVDQLSSPDEKAILRNKIIEELGQLFSPVEIRNVYFIDYVLQ